MRIKYSEISDSVLLDIFRIVDNRDNYITVFDENAKIMGYLTLKDACAYFSEGILHLSKVQPRTHQSNFHSYQLALSTLPAYASELKKFLISLNVKTIGIDSNISDFNYIKSYIPEINFLRCEDSPNIVFDVVIILRCPKILQYLLYGVTKTIKIADLLESFLIADLLEFAKNKNIKTLFIEGPISERLKNKEKFKYYKSKLSLEEILLDKEYLLQFCLGDSNQMDYVYNPIYGVLSGNRIVTNGISLRSGYFKSSKLNVNNLGERKTLPYKKNCFNRDIYIFGSCLTFGIFTDDEHTFPSYLQKYINDSNDNSIVHNMGVKGKALLINDLLLALQTDVKSQDILVFVSPISSFSKNILEQNHIKFFDFTEHLNQDNNPNCVYLNNLYHSNIVVYKELAKFSFRLISNLLTSSNRIESLYFNGFTYNGKSILFDQHYMWKHIFLKKYLTFLNSLPRPSEEAVVGSVLITANPFTIGHASLIQRALKYCDYLYIFVVENDSFEFSYSRRIKMVNEFISCNPKCCVAPSGDIWGSKELFPEYFNRNFQDKKITISQEDAYIFGNYIAPSLRITKRFVGEENNDKITHKYNQYLQKYLPSYGIKVIQFERVKNSFGIEIGGKKVREIILKNGIDDETLPQYLPKTTIDVIKRTSQKSSE